MAKDWKKQEFRAAQEEPAPAQEMTLEEARSYRASLYKAAPVVLTTEEKREAFRKFWAEQKYKYGKSKDLEPILWAHLKASKQDDPAKFEDGLAHFGLKKVK